MKTKSNYSLAALWLLSVICFILVSPKWVFAPAAWFAPALLIIVMQSLKIVRSIIIGFLALFVSGLVANYHVMPFPGIFFVLITFTTSLMILIPYVLHRLLYLRYNSWISIFIFPCAFVILEYFNAQGDGGGTWGLLAYSQFNNLQLLQLASLTGIFGISFILYWFSSTLALVVDRKFSWNSIKVPVCTYSIVLLSVLLFGTFKSNPYFYSSRQTVRMAGITGSNLSIIKATYEDAFDEKTDIDLDVLVDQGKLTITSPELQEMQKGLVAFIENPLDKKFDRSRAMMETFQDTLLSKALREVKAGAKIISFSEALMFTNKEQESKLIEKGQAFASQNHVYLLLTAATVLPGKIEQKKKFMENKSWMIDPQGKIINTFLKNRPVPMAEAGSVRGDGVVPVMKTTFGNIGTSICYDADFPSLIRQAGQKHADIFLLPSGDWKEISPYHAQMAIVRAVENGFSLFRTVSGAFSIACDYHGRIIATKNYYDKGDKVLVAYLPQQGIQTIYSKIGDCFVTICAIGFVILIAFAFVKRK